MKMARTSLSGLWRGFQWSLIYLLKLKPAPQATGKLKPVPQATGRKIN